MASLHKLLSVAAAASLYCGLAAASQLPARVVLVNSSSGAKASSVDLLADERDNGYFAPLSDLRALSRVRWNLVHVDSGLVRLNDLGQVEYDALSGELRITVAPELLRPQVIDGRSATTVIPDAAPMPAALIDYDLRTQLQNGRQQSGAILNGVGYVGLNRIELDGSAITQQPSHINRARITREDLEDSSLLEVGTLFAVAGARGAPAPIVGIGFRRDRGVTPGYITSPQLRVDGQAASRSTVDILIDNQKVSSSQVGAGPFSVVAQPAAEGGVAQVVIRDELGQEHVVRAQLYANPSLLEIGQTEFGAWAGGANTQDLHADGLVAMGYYRRGVTRWLTAESSYERSTEAASSPAISRASIAADVSTPLGDLSFDMHGLGGVMQGSVTYSGTRRFGAWSLSASGQATQSQPGYFSIGGGAAQRYNRSGTLSVSAYGCSTYMTTAASPSGRLVLVGGSFRLPALDASVSVSVSRFSSGDHTSASAFVGISIPFGAGVSGSFSTRSALGGIVKRAAVNASVSNDVNAALAAEGSNGVQRVQSDVFANLSVARLMTSISSVEGQKLAARASLSGSAVLHAHGAALMPPRYSDAGYAVVDLGEAGVAVSNGLGARAVTGADGYAVLPLPALRAANVTIDANTVAPESELDLTPMQATAHRFGGVQLKRHATHGQFVSVPAVTGNLVVNDVTYSITDRGVWLELPPGNYTGSLSGKPYKFTIQ